MSDHYGCRCGRSHGNPDGVCSRCRQSAIDGLTWSDVVESSTSEDAIYAAASVDRANYDSDEEYVEAVVRAAIEAGSER